MSGFSPLHYIFHGRESANNPQDLTSEEVVELPSLYELTDRGLAGLHNQTFRSNPGWLLEELSREQNTMVGSKVVERSAVVAAAEQTPAAEPVLDFEEAARRRIAAIREEANDGQAAA